MKTEPRTQLGGPVEVDQRVLLLLQAIVVYAPLQVGVGRARVDLHGPVDVRER